MAKKKQNKTIIPIEAVDNSIPINENLLIGLFALAISVIFFFPMFLGKVDTPSDIRNYWQYPWKSHYIDEKIVKNDISFPEFTGDGIARSGDLYHLSIPVNGQKQTSIKLDFNKLEKIPIQKDHNYYLSFDFLPLLDKNSVIDFSIYFLDKNQNFTNLPFSAIPLKSSLYSEANKSQWLSGRANFNLILDKLGSFNALKDYQLFIVFYNKTNEMIPVNVKNLKIYTEDFSYIKPDNVHNYYLDDLIAWFTPAREFFSSSIKQGKIPFWNPYVLTGTEFIAEPQVGYFNPIYFLSYLFFDHFTAHNIILFVFFILCIIGSYKLARFWKLDIYGALLSSLVYAFNPFMISWIGFEHTVMIFSIIPFLILYYEKALNSIRFLSKELIISSLLFGLIILSGHLQIAYYALIIFFLYAVYKVLIDRKNIKKHVFIFFFISFFGLCLSGILLSPFFYLLSYAHRLPVEDEILKQNSFSFESLKSFFSPYYKGAIKWLITDRYSLDRSYLRYKTLFFTYYIYFGLLPFFISLFSIKTVLKNTIVRFLLATIIFSFMCAGWGDFYVFLRSFIPGFKLLQNIRFLQLFSWCIPFLVGIGFINFFKLFPNISQKQKNIITIIVIFITVIDLISYSSFFLSWSNRKDFKPIHNGGGLEYLLKEKTLSNEPFRVLCIESLYNLGFNLKPASIKPNNLWTYGIEDVNGYASFLPKDLYWTFVYTKLNDVKKLYTNYQALFFNNTNLIYPTLEYKNKIFDLLNVKYFITSPDTILDKNHAENIFNGDCRIWLNKNYLPRAFLTYTYKIIPDKAKAIGYLDSEEFNPRHEVIFQEISNSLKQTVDSLDFVDPLYKIDFEKYENEKVLLNVKTNKPAFLVLGNNLTDNWKVKVNGKEQPILKANIVQASVFLDKAGQYKVEFYYYPKYFYVGLIITSLSLIILCILYLYLKISFKKYE